MSLLNFLKGELLEIIEWVDDSRDTLAFRFPDEDKAIKRGAQLIVRESQVVQFVYLGQFGDTFQPGKHRLETNNIPILTRLASWKYGFESPFKADIYYVVTRLFTGNKWGTANPIMLRDEDLGVVRARAYGTYDFRVADPRVFLKEVAGTDHHFRLDEFADTMRSKLISSFSEALAQANVPIFEAARRHTELGQSLLPLINSLTLVKYGIELTNFVVENISVPEEVEKAIDKRSSMSAIGNLNDYVKFNLAQGMAQGGTTMGGLASELAMGTAIAQQLMQQQNNLSAQAARPAQAPAPALPDLLGVDEAAAALGVAEADVLASIDSGELKAKKIGSVYRIKRAALDEFLNS